MSEQKKGESLSGEMSRTFFDVTFSQAQESDLSDLLFFSELSSIERYDILPALTVQEYAAGTSIISADTENTDVFFMLTGEAEISLETRSGQHIHFNTIRQGEYFGEFSAIDGDPRSAQVTAVMRARIIRMHRKTFLSILFSHPKLSLRLMERLVAMIRAGNQKILSMSTMTIIERLFELLKDKGEPYGQNTVVVRNPPSQSRLAAELGTTRETVSRAINKLLVDQVVVRGDNSIYIRTDAVLRR